MLFLLTLFACEKENVECSEELSCGFGETCVEGVCTSNTCVTSAQCSMESHCSNGTCVDGCQNDKDCYPGDYCDLAEGACVSTPCYDSHLDCGFKEYCDQQSGDCREASGYFCRECEVDADCGGGGNVCAHWGLERDFCGVACETNSDCPSGFGCYDWQTDDGGITRQCLTYCWLYIDERPIPPGDMQYDNGVRDEALWKYDLTNDFLLLNESICPSE